MRGESIIEGITIEIHPNLPADCRIYHVREALTDNWIESSTPGSNRGAVCEAVMALRGVEEVWVKRYLVQVMKGKAFTWDEVDAEVLEFLTPFAGEKKGERNESFTGNVE